MHAEHALLSAHLVHGQRLYRLSLDAPERVPSWDVLVLTASNPAQADLYRARLEALRAQGRLPAALAVAVIEDPDGARIGSGGATLHVLRQLAREHGDALAARRILLIHAGGDSKRLPWASVAGKLFVPFPLHAHPDHPVPTLLEHLLAVLAPLPPRLEGGALVVASGDVLPLCDATALHPPADSAAIVVTPATLDVAGRHGVAALDAAGRVCDLLQKADPATLARHGAVIAGGLALIDTGLLVFRGAAVRALVRAASADPDPVAALVAGKVEISVYEELLAPCLPSRHDWLRRRPLGEALIAACAGVPLAACRLDAFGFVHLGSNAEYLGHLAASWSGGMARRLLAQHGAMIAASATILSSRLDQAVRVGHGSLVADSVLGPHVTVGNRCALYAVVAEDLPLAVPDNTCLWQVAVAEGWATLCCGVDDNPKDDWRTGTFLGQRLDHWLAERGVDPATLWEPGEARTLWSARLFPVAGGTQVAAGGAWLLDPTATGDGASAEVWRRAPRISMAMGAARFLAARQAERGQGLHDRLVLRHLGHAVSTLADVAVGPFARALSAGERPALAALAERVPLGTRHPIAASRRFRLRADLLAASGCVAAADHAASQAWDAVSAEVDAALAAPRTEPVTGLRPGTTAASRLPARFDLAGGWSDTPPFCLERPARVLNLAFTIDGRLPIGAEATALAERRWIVELGDGTRVVIDDPAHTAPDNGVADPVALLKVALRIAGYGSSAGITQGVHLRAWSDIPKGSGLGASSILAAAIVTALARLAGRSDAIADISAQVLAVEQALTTRGGWQDQLGGLVPGVKLLGSLPLRPLAVRIEPVQLPATTVASLERRLVIAYTGISRLARDVLQRVVAGYLSRDTHVVTGTTRLAELADEARTALVRADFDALGAAMREAWFHHQQLDPHCSNPAVDALMDPIEPHALGWKLAGAGGGGFVGIIARSDADADRIRTLLAGMPAVRCCDWRLFTGEAASSGA